MVHGFGLPTTCSCMAGSIVGDIYGTWVGILGDGCSFGMKVGSRMMIVKVDASGMCDSPLSLCLMPKVGLAFVSSSFWIRGR
jgi:hypothetical protein